MSDKTGIEWTDATWNPTTGCDRVSPGCDNCYALTLAARLKAMGSARYQNDGNPNTSGPGFRLTTHADALDQPLRWTKPRRIFVNSMSDLFHDDVPDDFIAQVWAVMAATPQHTYQILTKRHARMRSFLRDVCRCGAHHPNGVHLHSKMMWAAATHSDTHVPGLTSEAVREGSRGFTYGHGLPNVWVGVSVENQQWADIRIPALLQTPAARRFLSCEPLLGPVDLSAYVPPATCECEHPETEHAYGDRTYGCQGGDGSEEDPICGCRKLRGEHDHQLGDPYVNHGLHWVIAGGESGRAARAVHPDWLRGLRDQCTTGAVPFHFKQWGEWAPVDPNSDAPLHEFQRVGKKAAGRELDGRTWDEFPA